MNELQRQVLLTRQVRLEIRRTQTKEAVSITDTTIEPVPDNRYRCLITLVRSDRPRYWNFLCFNCGHRIVELQNMEVYTIDDFYDPQNVNNSAVGLHCVGQGRQCPYSYFFHVQ